MSTSEVLLTRLRAARSSLPPGRSSMPLMVALSGGLDSMALLHALVALRKELPATIQAIHVHHGLSPNADAWAQHCEQACAALDVPFQCARVVVAGREQLGVEAAAREARYQALAQAAANAGAVLGTAHHADDQIETVLLQLLRGTGLHGVSGMPVLRTEQSVYLWRPFLDVDRTQLEAFVQEQGIAYVQDESNGDTAFSRNALRHQVLPKLHQYFPAFRETVRRFAGLAEEAQAVLDELAQADVQALRLSTPAAGDALSLEGWSALSDARQRLVLRAWLCAHGLRAPTQAWLQQLQRQLVRARPEAMVQVTHQGRHIRRYRDMVLLEPPAVASTEVLEPQRFTWQGEASVELPAWGGRLIVEPAAQWGVPADILRNTQLTIAARSGAERFQAHPLRPRRRLKNLYQEAGIAPWQRARLPIIWSNGRLLFAAGLGIDTAFLSDDAAERYRLEWAPAAVG